MKKQTAVQYLVEQILGNNTKEWELQIEKALIMEQIQLSEARIDVLTGKRYESTKELTNEQ
jgi:hypothetical protein